MLRHVSDAFVEDPLRVLRIARFAARYKALGFRVADDTLTLMRTLAASGELDTLTPNGSGKKLHAPCRKIMPMNTLKCCVAAVP